MKLSDQTFALKIASLFKQGVSCALALILLSTAAFADDSYSSFDFYIEGEGHDIILIPGLMSDGSIWQASSKALSEQYRVHTISISGFGTSSTEKTNTFNDVERELTEYISKLEKPTVVGHSIGGFLAMSLAIKAPESVSRVVSVDGLPFIGPIFTRNPNTSVADISAQASFIKGHYSKLSTEQLAAEVARGIYVQATSPKNQKRVIEMSSLSHAKTVGEMMHGVMTTDLRADLHKIKASVLMLGASGAMPNDAGKDQVENLYKHQFKSLPSAQIKMNRNARHFIMLDDHEWLMQNILKVLGE